MLSISGVTLHSFSVALRWARMQKDWSNNIKEWGEEESKTIQWICEELDRRHNRTQGIITSFCEKKD